MAVEPKRGCGFRKVGGLYLVSGKDSAGCCRLPIELDICPTCGAGIKQSRGWTWIDPKLIADSLEDVAPDLYCHGSVCPFFDPIASLGERAGLIWVGEKFYRTPRDFNAEAGQLGISRRIASVPKGFKLGETWVLLAHPTAVEKPIEGQPLGAEFVPGIFRAFKPTAIEKIVTQTEAKDAEAMAKLEKRGITPVAVPDDDEDHK